MAQPTEAKFRSISVSGRAFGPIKACEGAVELLEALKFRVVGDRMVLFEMFNIEPAVLDYLMRLEEVRDQLKKKELEDWQAEKKRKDAEKERILNKFGTDRVEASQRQTVASVSKLVPFSGQPKVGCSDIGIGKNTGGG